MNTVLTGVALLATGALAGPGSAVVKNACSYAVHLSNTPASGGGYSNIDQMLAPGGTYSQVYTQLSNGNGWSIKLSQSGNFGSNLMQYEYTYHNDGTIWYDLSEVDGNPWDGNWEITASPGCTPRQAAYRYSTDDAYGMQSCADSATITVTLCSGTGHVAPSSPASDSWGSSPSEAASQPPSQAPSPQKSHKSHKSHKSQQWGPPGAEFGNKVVASPEPEISTPPTSDAPASEAWNGPAVTVTNVVYTTINEIVTAEAAEATPHKRHVHHPRHPHHRA